MKKITKKDIKSWKLIVTSAVYALFAFCFCVFFMKSKNLFLKTRNKYSDETMPLEFDLWIYGQTVLILLIFWYLMKHLDSVIPLFVVTGFIMLVNYWFYYNY